MDTLIWILDDHDARTYSFFIYEDDEAIASVVGSRIAALIRERAAERERLGG